jgi:predicted MFS family arabinose efflux permease
MTLRFQITTFGALLAAAMVVRLVVDTAAQLFNPYLAIFAAGTGVSIITMGRLLSLRSFIGILSPLFGTLADRFGYRTVMRLSLLGIAAGMFLMGASNGMVLLTAGMVLVGLGFSGFVPILQAYMSARLPYDRRAQGIGILEYSWALASIIGLFAMGLIIEEFGWRAPFFVLSAGMLLGWLLFGLLPPAGTSQVTATPDLMPFSWRRLPRRFASFFDLGENNRSAYAVITAHALLFFGGFHVIIIHGGWLEMEYGLTAALLGTVALVQGVADLGGSVLVSLITDRVGKRRSVIGGLWITCGVFLLMPFMNVGLVAAVASLALMRFCFEFTIVSDITLISEQSPLQRGKVMSLGAAFALMGATAAGLSGPWAYATYDVWGLGPVAAVSTAMGAVILMLWARERPRGLSSND